MQKLAWFFSFSLLCCFNASADITLNQALESTLKQVVQPAFAEFHAAAQEFEQQAQDFVQHTDKQHLENTRTAWKTLSRRWNQVRLYRFGPLIGESLVPVAYYFDSQLLKGKNFNKAIHQDIAASMKSTESNVSVLAQHLAQKNFKVQGLLATEILLFDSTYSLTVYQNTLPLARYLQAHAQVLSQRSQVLSQQWQDTQYIQQLLADPKHTQSLYFNALWDSLSFTHKERLSSLFKKDKVYPHRVEALYSQSSKENLSSWLYAVKQGFQAEKKIGFYALLEASGYATGEFFMMQLEQVDQAIEDLPASLNKTLSTDPDKVKLIATRLHTTMDTFARDVLNILEVDLGFNFNDGD